MAPADLALLQQWTQRGNADAFEALASRYSGMVFATCTRILGNPGKAEDVTQECFEKLATIRDVPRGHLGAWLHRVATNRAIDRIRRDTRRQTHEKQYAAERDTSTEIQWDDIHEHVDQAIAELPDHVRDPIVAHYLEGRTHAQIAEDLGISRQAVTRRIGRGIEKVRGTLRKRGIPVAGAALAAMLTANASQAAPIPASLQTVLGRIAVAGYQGAGVAGATTATAAAAGSFLTAKTALIGAMIVAAAGLATWNITQREDADARPPAASATESAAPGTSDRVTPPKPYLAERSSARDAQMASATTTASGNAAPGVVAEIEGGVITGRVYDADSGEGLAGLRPDAVPEGTGSSVGKPEESDASGRYRITGLPAGTYQVNPPRPSGFPRMTGQFKSVTVTLSENQTAEGIDFALDKGIPVSGRITNPDGNPVEEVHIGAIASGWPGAESTKSNNNGTFTIRIGQPCNDLLVQARNDDFESDVVGPLTVTQDGLDGLELQLAKPKTASIAGMVVDSGGRPVANAGIHLQRGKEDYLVGSGRAETAPNGSFQLEKLAPGEYGVLVTAPGQSTFSGDDEVMRVTLTEDQALNGLRLVLGADKGGLAIAGRVVDTSGKPVDSVQISTSGPLRQVATTGKDGTFLLTGLREGVYNLHAHHVRKEWTDPTYSPARASNVRAGTTDVELVMQGQGTVEGRVLRADTGEPLTDFELFISNGVADRFSSRLLINGQQVKSPEGRFSREMYVGPATVTARAPGFAPAFQTVEVREHETTGGIELRLEPASAVSGTVVNRRGEPVAGAQVFLGPVPSPHDRKEPAAETAADGTFVIESLSPDIEVLSAVHPKYGPGSSPITEPITITLDDYGIVEGTVTMGGEPLAGVSVVIQYIDRGKMPSLPSWDTVTEADGTFRVSGLPKGTAEVDAKDSDHRRVSREAIIESGATTRVDLRFTPGTSVIHGHIDAGRQTPRMMRVQCTVATGTGVEGCSVDADANGAYCIDNLPAGRVRLAAQIALEAGPMTQFAELDLAQSETVEQNFDFSATGTLSGRIKGFSADHYGAVIVLDGEFAVPASPGPEFFTRINQVYEDCAVAQGPCDDTGAYAVEGLPPGTYTALAVTVPRNDDDNANRARGVSATVTIEKDASVTLDFEMP